MSRFWLLSMVCWLMCQFVHLPVCPAQGPKADPAAPALTDSGPIMLATFGWGGTILGDRWGPIWVYVTAGDRAVAGTIVVEFPQDDTQTARISVPFAATPNKTTQVPVVAALPANCNDVTFTMVDEQGRVVRSLAYTRVASDRTAPLPPFAESGRGLFVCLGRCSLVDSVRAWTNAAEPIRTQRVGRAPKGISKADLEWSWSRAAAAQTAPEELSSSWMAYDGVLALVVNPQNVGSAGQTVDPRAIEAVHTWVRSGGRLVVMADGAGEAWKSWIPGEARDFVSLEPVETGPLPRAVSEAVINAGRVAAAPKLAETEPARSPEPVLPGPSATAPHRAVVLSKTAEAAGWRGRWAVEGGPSLLGEGPVGYGHVTVLGLDPMRTPVEVSARASALVWRDALEPVVADWLGRAAGGLNQGYWTGTPQDRASNAAVERLGDVPVIGDSIFAIIAAAVLVLVALVGPGDFFLLRRFRAGHLSWLTALLWIALAGVVAFGAPRVLRTAPTQINRLSVVDRMLGPGGQTLTFCTAMTGVYAGQSGTARVTDPDLTAWWRGKSVDYGESEFRGMALVPTVQAAAGGAAGSMRGNPLMEVALALWTFRAFADDSIASPAWTGVTARVHREGSGYRVAVAGLPKGVTINEATVRVGEQWFGLTQKAAPLVIEPPRPPRLSRDMKPPPPPPIVPVGEAQEGAWSGLFRDEFGSAGPSRAWSNPAPDPNQPYFSPWYTGQTLDVRPGPLLDLPGADRRGQAVERAVATGRFAAVYLNAVGCPSDVKLAWPAQVSHTAVVRLVVPLEGEP